MECGVSLHFCLFVWVLNIVSAGHRYGALLEHNQCKELSDVQTAVIQILGTHYEYGKGIHNLHELVTSLQSDFSVLKNKMHKIESDGKKDEINNILQSEQRDSPNIKDMVHDFEKSLSNVTSALGDHKDKFKHIQRRLNGLKRTVRKTKKYVKSYETELQSEDHKIQDYIKKQTNINAYATARIRRLETLVRRALSEAAKPKTDCPLGFIHYGQSCYKFVNRTYNWVNAEKHCQRLHPRAHLVGIETKEENDFILMYRKYNAATWTSKWVWTGGNDLRNEGHWTWVGTGKPIQFEYWSPAQPDEHMHAEDQHCIYYTSEKGHYWADWNCNTANINSVCEINL